MDETSIPVRRCQQLEVWHRAHQLVLGVYLLSRWLPEEERTQLSAELRCAAVSIPANILAGLRGDGSVERMRAYDLAQASLEELRYYLMVCRDLGFDLQYGVVEGESEQVATLLSGLMSAAHGQHHGSEPGLDSGLEVGPVL
jgi:four helix bundle protein